MLPYRELDEVLGLSAFAGDTLSEVRRGKNARHLLTGLLRQSIYGRLAGYEDVNDAERLAPDPVMRAVQAVEAYADALLAQGYTREQIKASLLALKAEADRRDEGVVR